MKIALFPGSFKPPHSGHLKVVETIMKKYNPDKFYIIISKRPRLLVVPYELKLAQFSEKEMENIAKKYKLKNASKKGLEIAAEEGKIPAISPEITKEFWKSYLETLPPKMKEKIKVSISNQPSPILYSFVIVKDVVKPTDELLLLKAEKDASNKRFSMFDNLNVKKQEILIPTFKDFNSWEMRKAISNKNWKEVEEFFPQKLNNSERKKLLELLKAI